MTREEAKDKMLTESVQYKNGLRTVALRKIKINNFIDKIFDDHEAQLKLASDVYSTDKMHMYQELKAKDEEIKELGEIVQQYLIQSKNYDAIIKAKDEETERLKAESKQAYIEGSKSCDDLIRFCITKIASLEEKLKVSNDSAIK